MNKNILILSAALILVSCSAGSDEKPLPNRYADYFYKLGSPTSHEYITEFTPQSAPYILCVIHSYHSTRHTMQCFDKRIKL